MKLPKLKELINEEVFGSLTEAKLKEGQFAVTKRPLSFVVGATNRWTQQYHRIEKPKDTIVYLDKFVGSPMNDSQNNLKGKKDVWVVKTVTKKGIAKYTWTEISESDLTVLSPDAVNSLKSKYNIQ
jgi:hypothetical protein